MISKFNKILMMLFIALNFALLLIFSGCEKKTPTTTVSFNANVPNAVIITANNDKEFKIPCKLNVKPNKDYFFVAKKDGYEENWFTISASQGQNLKRNIELIPKKTLVLIESDPKGAEVVFNDRIVGSTPCTIKNLTNGDYKLFLNKLGYTQRQVRWSIKNSRPKLIEVKLTSNFGTLKINSKPAGAKVLIEDKMLGRTPLDQDIKSGVYEVVLEKNGYAVERFAVNIIAEKTLEKNVRLKLLPGSLKVTASIKNAKLSINGEEYNIPVVLDDLQAGKYEVTVSGDNVSPQIKEIRIMPGQQTKEHFDMISNTGNIELLVTTPGVVVYLDGKEVGKVQASKKDKNIAEVFKISDVPEGIHKIRLFHKLARPNNKLITLKVKKNVTTYTKRITIWVANCRLKVKGSDRTVVGYLRGEGDDYILFMKAPGITQKILKKNIKRIKILR